MKSIAVFCGSSPGQDPAYLETAGALGALMAKTDRQLVYGGAKIGLMGAVADAVMENGGRVIGVLPTFMSRKEVAHHGLTELILVKSMHERKRKMAELVDGFIALPGGFGTLEEFAEILTWGQLGLHQKPMGLLNQNGFYDRLLGLFDHMQGEGFLRPRNREMVLSAPTPEALITEMEAYQAPEVPIWIREDANT